MDSVGAGVPLKPFDHVRDVDLIDKLSVPTSDPPDVAKFYNMVDGKEVDESWTLDGLREPGLYPIVPRSGTWYLDKGRKNPRLKISRKLIPLAPAFAMTSHAAQSQTLFGGAIVDLCTPGAYPMGAYVATTRVKRREDVLIYRPFKLASFQHGERAGPSLLLKHLRRDRIDWKALEEEYMLSKRCSGCHAVLRKHEYLKSQWNRTLEPGRVIPEMRVGSGKLLFSN